MTKVPCGGFKLDENFLGMNENDELSLTGGGEGKAYQQLVTDGEGKATWEDRLAYDDSRVAVPPEGNNRFIKVADTVPFWLSANKNMKVWVSNNTSERVIDIGSTGYIINHDGSFIVSQNGSLPYVAVIMEDDCEFNAMPSTAFFPEKGVYFLWSKPGSSLLYTAGIASANSETPEIAWDGNIDMIKKLDKKFLPDQTVFYALPDKRLIDAPGGVYITLEQAKAAGLNFVIQTRYGIAKPIFVSYDDASATFYAAEMTDSSGEHYSFTQFIAGVGDGPT